MKSRGSQFREILARTKPLALPGIHDPLGIKLVETLGFEAAYMGGWATGAHLTTTEPGLTMTEQVECARRAAVVVNIPLIVDADAGFGDVMHTMRTVRDFEQAGVAGIHIEDQVFPKRARYHADVINVLPLKDMIDKLEAAVKARQDKDFFIIARTDTPSSVNYGGIDEAIRRGKAFIDAGADAVMPRFLYNWKDPGLTKGKKIREDVERFAQGMAGSGVPLFFIDVWSGLSTEEIGNLGYDVILHPLAATVAGAKATMDIYGNLFKFGNMNIDLMEFVGMQLKIQDILGLSEYYALEERLQKEEEERKQK